MVAKENIKYAVIVDNVVSSFFTKESMSEWNENDICAVEVPSDNVRIGTKYINGIFIEEIKEDIEILKEIPTKEGVLYAVLNENNEISYTFNSTAQKTYSSDLNIIELTKEQELEVACGMLYDKDTKELVINIQTLKQIYTHKVNGSYTLMVAELLGEDIPVTEMISWETQEKEARAYLQSKNKEDAPSIVLMAQAQGRDLEEFANKVLAKANKYKITSSVLIGYRQKLIKQLEIASTKEEIRAISFDKSHILHELNTLMQSQKEMQETQPQKVRRTRKTTPKDEEDNA